MDTFETEIFFFILIQHLSYLNTQYWKNDNQMVARDINIGKKMVTIYSVENMNHFSHFMIKK